MKEKTYVEDIDRNIYDFKYDDKDAYKLKAGLTPEIVEQLSKEKHDPAWMQNFRLYRYTTICRCLTGAHPSRDWILTI